MANATTRPPPAAATSAGFGSGRPISVFLVDDSSVVRRFVTKTLEQASDVAIIGTASDGAAAIRDLRGKTVDVVVLDVEMPILDGLSALPEILKATTRPPKVVMASTLTTRGASISIQALVKGAADYVPKPTSIGSGGAEEFGKALLERVRAWGALAQKEGAAGGRPTTAPPKKASVPTPAVARPSLRPSGSTTRLQALAIGCSTGGPQALLKVFDGLKGCSLGPIFVTQHMPPTFTTLFAQQLGRASGRECHEALEGEVVEPNVIYVAPGDFHMLAEGRPGSVVLRRSKGPQENYCRPAVDPMFRSLSTIYKERLLAVVLTGMGQDGCKGAKLVVDSGGLVLAQDEASSVVWGMPGAVANAGLASELLPLDSVGRRIGQLLGGRS